MIMQQTTNTILMIRPVNFRMNEQTAVNNYYQKVLDNLLPASVNTKAQQEFDGFVEKLKNIGVNVIVVNDTTDCDTPDSIFPNNWISFHQNGNIGMYPMFAENRRLERRDDVLQILEDKGFVINEIVDYTEAEEESVFLEGTGSCLGETFAVICLSSIDDKKERKNVMQHLKEDGKEIIDISEDQVNNFAGNMLQVKGVNGDLFLVMSQAAFDSLTNTQLNTLKKHNAGILSSSLDTIEACGGGSARCMMAEVFLPKA